MKQVQAMVGLSYRLWGHKRGVKSPSMCAIVSDTCAKSGLNLPTLGNLELRVWRPLMAALEQD